MEQFNLKISLYTIEEDENELNQEEENNYVLQCQFVGTFNFLSLCIKIKQTLMKFHLEEDKTFILIQNY